MLFNNKDGGNPGKTEWEQRENDNNFCLINSNVNQKKTDLSMTDFFSDGGDYVTPPANATDHELVLTPLGLISRSGKELVDDLPVLGSVLTTVGVVLDFFTGFAPPRTAYADYTQGYTYWNAGDTWRAWGPLPADSGDYFTTAVLNVTYPGWVNSQYFQDERGFLSPTPFGDIVDVLLSDAPAALFGQYHMLVVTTTIRTMKSELRYKLEQYVRDGGAIVVTAEGIEGTDSYSD